MLNQQDLYTGFNRALKVYGGTSAHVQLIAKQLGVLAGEISDYVIANPTLVTYELDGFKAGKSDTVLGQHYQGMRVTSVTSIPFLTHSSNIYSGMPASEIMTVSLLVSEGTFAASTTVSNWTIDAGLTGLTLASVGTGTAIKVLTFTTAGNSPVNGGVLTIQAKAVALSGTVASDVVTLEFEQTSDTCGGIDSSGTTQVVTASTITIDNDVENVLVATTATGACAVTLDGSAMSIHTLNVKDFGGNAGTNNITIDTANGETIDGDATLIISGDDENATLFFDGVNYLVM